MPADGHADRTVSTGGLTVGRYVMDVGAPEGMRVQRVRARGKPPPELTEALRQPPPAGAVEAAIEDAHAVAGRIDRAAALFTRIARGDLDVATVAGELEGLLDLLRRLDRAGRYKEALRLARVLARLLALASRLAALVTTLRIAVEAAVALADSKALAWALHELGTLALGAGDAEAAGRDLGEARRLREETGDLAGLEATEHNLAYVGRGGLLSPRTQRVAAGAGALAVVLVLGVVAVAGDDAPDPSPTPTPTATGGPPGDDTPPRITLTTDELTNEPVLTGTAGTAEGDRPEVTVTISGASEPVVVRGRRDDDGRFAVGATLASGTYTARAEQGDEAGNVGRSETVTFTVDVDPPEVSIAEPADGTETGTSPQFNGAAGTAEGDEPVLTLTVPPQSYAIDVAADGAWSREVAVQSAFDSETGEYSPITATAEQRDASGNVGRATVTFTAVPEVD